jgi:hypothetical protein
MRRALPALLAALLSACGEDGPTAEPGPYVAQEIWVTHAPAASLPVGVRPSGLTREEALALVTRLRESVLAGSDIGLLAKRHSQAPGAAAFGFSDWRAEPGKRMDVRDHALVRTPIGGVTPVEEWLGGFWFAKRIPKERGTYLEAIFKQLAKTRARAAAVAIQWKGAMGAPETIRRSKEEARARADDALKLAQGGVDFAEVVSLYSDDETRDRGGLLMTPGADGKAQEWLHVASPYIPQPVLDAIFEGEPGTVWPHVIETSRAYVIVKVLDRQEIAWPPAPREPR